MILTRRMAAAVVAFFWAGAAFGQATRLEVSASPMVTDSARSPSDNPAAQPDDFVLQLQKRYYSLFQKASPAVVQVNAAVSAAAGDTPYIWTGFFISKNGDILTTHADLLQAAEQTTKRVWVQYNRIGYPAEIKGYDLVSNLAVLHVTTPLPKDFAVLDLADSPDVPAIGAMLFAVTSKEGQLPGPSMGLLQGYNVNFGEVQLATLHLRTNIPDDGGEGGSPVLDLQGRLVGIMIWSLKDSRSSLILPARAALRVRDDLLTRGKVAYGRLGFASEQRSDAESGVRVMVTSVDYGGPALDAGLKAGDVVRSLGTMAINNEDDLRQAKFYLRPGQDVALSVRRGNEDIPLTLHIGEMPPDPAPILPTAASLPKPAAAVGSSNVVPGIPDPNMPPPPILKGK